MDWSGLGLVSHHFSTGFRLFTVSRLQPSAQRGFVGVQFSLCFAEKLCVLLCSAEKLFFVCCSGSSNCNKWCGHCFRWLANSSSCRKWIYHSDWPGTNSIIKCKSLETDFCLPFNVKVQIRLWPSHTQDQGNGNTAVLSHKNIFISGLQGWVNPWVSHHHHHRQHRHHHWRCHHLIIQPENWYWSFLILCLHYPLFSPIIFIPA